MPEVSAVPVMTCDLSTMRNAELVAHAHSVDSLAAQLFPCLPATALVLNQAEDALVVESDRRVAGAEPGLVEVELPMLPYIPTSELTDLQGRAATIAAGLESEQRSGAWWRALADVCVDEELRRLLNSTKAESVQ